VPGLRADGLYKIFGRRTEEALERLRAGATAEDVQHMGATAAVIDASFEVEPGEIFVVMGLSGSGKSTLIRMINGLLQPTAGHVYVGDKDVATLGQKELRRLRNEHMSMVFQHFALLPHRTVLENAGYALRVRGAGRAKLKASAQQALAMVGLEGWEEKLPHELSGGMKQRVGLARALAAETDIMLMDEAFSALDPLIRREMQDQLLKLQHALNKTIVFITHDLNEAMRLGDKIAVMRSGRIVQIGTSEDILQDPASDYVAQFVQDVDRTRVLTATAVMERPRAVVVETAGPRAALRTMRQEQTSAAFVISRGGQLRGAIGDSAAQAAMNAGRDNLRDVLDKTCTVAPDTPLAEVFAPSAESPLPVAVVDPDDRLLGVIPRATLLTAMASLAPSESGQLTADTADGTETTRADATEAAAATVEQP
jgi:glycine betaine/proline transport system ATP-binding protein